MDYKPNPIDTSEIKLPQEILELAEQLAENTHEIWAQGRMNDGWKYGEERNDINKTTPCLLPYKELPDFEKKYDRNTALETLKVILYLGFKLEKCSH